MVDKAKKATPAKTTSPIGAGIEKITGGYKPVATPKDATGMQGVGITGTDRNVAKEIEAAKLGYSAEYIASRGGLNSQGYYNDVALSGQLTAAEQASVRLPNGSTNTQAMADILQKKQIAELVSKGVSLKDATEQVSGQYGIYATKGSGDAGGYDANGNLVDGGQYNADGTLAPVGGNPLTDKTTKTLARNTFANTLALLMGDAESQQPWVNELYNLVQGFINTGSTYDEAINLGLQEAKKKGVASPFVRRFDGVFKLQDRLNSGEAISVPTIAEFVASQSALGDLFREVGLTDLASLENTGTILGTGKSVLAVGELISNVFSAIDNAPTALKTDLQTYFPGVDRTAIAKAILLGPAGAIELTKKVRSIEQLSAAKSQGLTIDLATGAEYAALGKTYGSSLTDFGTVAKALPTYEKILEIGSGQDVKSVDAQASLQRSIFLDSASEQEKIQRAIDEEQNRFRGGSGTSPGVSLASQRRSAGLI